MEPAQAPLDGVGAALTQKQLRMETEIVNLVDDMMKETLDSLFIIGDDDTQFLSETIDLEGILPRLGTPTSLIPPIPADYRSGCKHGSGKFCHYVGPFTVPTIRTVSYCQSMSQIHNPTPR